MKKIIILILLLFDFSFAQNFKDVFNKKITIKDGEYNSEFIKSIIEKELGLGVIIEKEKEIYFNLEGIKDKPIYVLLDAILRIYKMEILFDKEKNNLVIKFSQKAKDRERQEDLDGILIAFKDVPFKSILSTLRDLFKKDFTILNEEKKDIKINCNLKIYDLKEFLEFLEKNYKIYYEEKDGKVFFK